jgi:dipeptidase E
MRLYLSSYLLGDEARELAAMVRRPTAVVIANALDHAASAIRESHLRTIVEGLGALGFSTEEVDLRRHFGAPARIETALREAGLVWVNGGNVFLLRRAMRQSGFDRFIAERRREDGLVYGGYSAGACVAGPTLRGAHLVDSRDATAAGYEDGEILDGLGLVPYCIAPHYQSGHPDSRQVDAMVEYYLANKLPFVALRDGEVIITTAA